MLENVVTVLVTVTLIVSRMSVGEHQNKVLAEIKQSTNTLLTGSSHVIAKLLIVSKNF